MRSSWINLKMREQQQALLTVLVVIMGAILFFLLVSLETTKSTAEIQPNTEIELSFVEISSLSSSSLSDASDQHTQIEGSIPTPIDVTESHPNEDQTQHYLGFTASEGKDDLNGIFGNEAGVDNENQPKTERISKRELLNKPVFESNTQEEGTIALQIWINSAGKVVKTALNASDSNTGSSYLIKLAHKGAMTMLFEAKPGAPTECVGTYKFTFNKI